MSSVKPRTIDDLGTEASNLYAKHQDQLDRKILEESRFVPQKAEISAITPYLPTELPEYLLPQRCILWANFEPPPSSFATSLLFSHQLIPSLGDGAKIEEELDRIEEWKKRRDASEEGGEDSHQEERRRKALLTMLQLIQKLERALSLINGRRGQYQRG